MRNKINTIPKLSGVIINRDSKPGKAFEAVPITDRDNNICDIFDLFMRISTTDSHGLESLCANL